MTSRRKFIELVALSTVAALAPAAAPDRARAATKRRVKAAPVTLPARVRTSAVEAEIARQQQSTAATLKTIRDFDLAPGSEAAFVFVAARAPRRRTPREAKRSAR